MNKPRLHSETLPRTDKGEADWTRKVSVSHGAPTPLVFSSDMSSSRKGISSASMGRRVLPHKNAD